MFKSKLLSEINFINHGFFGRKGGVSSSFYLSLNASYNIGDDNKNVDKNREIIANKFQLPAAKLLSLKQVHSTKIVYVNNNQLFKDTNTIEADGMITSNKSIILGIYTADCIPILFVDTISKSISAIHCGWKGLLNGIIQNTIQEFKKISSKNNIIMSIGPCIHESYYEVDEIFYQNFLKKDLDSKDFFKKSILNQNYSFNLPFYAYNIGIKNGITENNIEILNLDTYENEDLFFSHRRSVHRHEKRGLQLSCIMLK